MGKSLTESPRNKPTWRTLSSVPEPVTTSLYALEPLGERHAELDFKALMSCRLRLREELQWGSWPPDDFTLERNRTDLQRHQAEFERGEAFSYTVLELNRTRCLGCIYIERCVAAGGALLAYWVIDDAIQMELELVENTVRWLHQDWRIERVVVPLRERNVRGLALAVALGYPQRDSLADGELADYRCFLSERSNSLESG